MKKTFLMIMMVMATALTAMAVTADELSGCRWQSKMENINMPEEAQGLTIQEGYDLVFTVDGQVEIVDKAILTMDDGSGLAIDVFMNISAQGRYLLIGNTLSITADASTVKYQLTEDDIRVRGVEDRNQENAIIASMMASMNQMQAESAQEIGKKPIVFTNVEINGKKMTAVEKSEDQSVKFTFTKKKL